MTTDWDRTRQTIGSLSIWLSLAAAGALRWHRS